MRQVFLRYSSFIFNTEEQPEVDEFGTPKGLHVDCLNLHKKVKNAEAPVANSLSTSGDSSVKPNIFWEVSNTHSTSASAKSTHPFPDEKPLVRSASVRIKRDDFEVPIIPSRSSSVKSKDNPRVLDPLSRSASVRVKVNHLVDESPTRSAFPKAKVNYPVDEPLPRASSAKSKAHSFDSGEAPTRASSVKAKSHTLEAFVSPFQSLFDLAARSPRLSRKSSVRKYTKQNGDGCVGNASSVGEISVGGLCNGVGSTGCVSIGGAVPVDHYDPRNGVVRNGILKSPSVRTTRNEAADIRSGAYCGTSAEFSGSSRPFDGNFGGRDSLDSTFVCPYGFPSPKPSKAKVSIHDSFACRTISKRQSG